jgi:hypothetical protein
VKSYPPQASQTGPLSYTLTITLEDVAKGKVESLRIPRKDICDSCAGTGQSWRDDNGTCASCNNRGWFKYEKALEVRVPAGIEHGARLRIQGEGNVDAPYTARGDLYITIVVSKHELFERKGKHLYTFVKLAEEEIVRGTEVIVPTLLDGRKQLRIPPGTGDGPSFRLAGLGLRSIENDERGDLFVKVGTQRVKDADDAKTGSSFSTPPSPQKSAVREFFLDNAKVITVVAGVLLVLGFFYITSYRNSPEPVSTPTNTNSYPSPTVQPTTWVRPTSTPTVRNDPPFSLPNGANIIPPQGRGDNKVQIINSEYSDIAVKLVSSSSQKTRRFVYIRAGKTATITNLPREVYLLRWESGSDWDVNTRRFLYARAIHQFDQEFDLRRRPYRIHFTSSPEGTLRELPINESDFEDK